MDTDFVDDPYDPENVEDAKHEVAQQLSEITTRAEQYLARRRQAYKSVFKEGNATPDDVECVMDDLATFCRAYKSTFNSGDPKLQDLLEGRKEVFYRIMEHTHLSYDAHFAKVTGASIQQT